MRVDLSRLSSLDRGIVGGAAVAFVAGFLPWWGVNLGIVDVSVSGWSAGFSAWAGTLLLTLAGVYVVLRRADVSLPSLPVGPSVVTAGVAALGLLLVIIRWLSLPRYRGVGVGSRYGIWIALIAGIVETAAAISALRASGETVPWTTGGAAAKEPEPAPQEPPGVDTAGDA